MHGMQVINLTRNNIGDVTRFGADLQHLEHLDLSFNKVARLHEGVFSSLYGLKGLWLGDNQIGWIAINAFANLTALVSLDLRNNRLAYLSSSVLQPIEVRLGELLLHGEWDDSTTGAARETSQLLWNGLMPCSSSVFTPRHQQPYAVRSAVPR